MRIQSRAPVRGAQRAKPPEAESSIAFEAPVEEPNLTLVKTINPFFQRYRIINVHITEIWRGYVDDGVWGARFAALGA